MICPRCRLDTPDPHPDPGACLLALDLSRANIERELARWRGQPTVRVKKKDLDEDEKTPER